MNALARSLAAFTFAFSLLLAGCSGQSAEEEEGPVAETSEAEVDERLTSVYSVRFARWGDLLLNK